MKIKYRLVIAIVLLVVVNSCKKSSHIQPENKTTECTDAPTLVWQVTIPSQTVNVGLAGDSFGNNYIAGDYNGTTDFGGKTLTGKASFFWKIDNNGKTVYAKQTPQQSVTAYGLNADSLQNLYLSCTTLDASNSQIFNLNKYDASGNLLWTKSFNTGNHSYISTVTKIDKAGDIYIVGHYSNSNGAVDFDPGVGVVNLTDSGTGYLQCLDDNGNLLWVKKIYDGIIGFGFLSSSNNFYLINEEVANTYSIEKINAQGDSINTKAFSYNSETLYIDVTDNFYLRGANTFKKFDSNVASVWNIETPSNGYTIFDTNDNSYLSGNFSGTISFNNGASKLTATGSSSSYLEKIDHSGNFVWATQISSAGSINSAAYRVDSFGNLYLFGNGSNSSFTYIARYNQCH